MEFHTPLWHEGGNHAAQVVFTRRNRLAEAVGMGLRLALLLVCWGLCSPCLAAEVAAYGYPFADPLEATVIGTPEGYRAALPEDIPTEIRQVQPFPRRHVPDIFWYAKTLRFALSAQRGPAPLAFVIPGTGAGFESSKSVILQRILYAAGLHVVSLPSPIHPNFIVSASASERPGLLADDARDLYRVMTLIRRQLQDELEITGYDLAGYSLGATHAAFVAALDDQQHALGFDRVLLINPPVDIARSAAVLDAMFAKHLHSLADFNHLFNQLMRLFSQFYEPTEQVLFSSDLVYEIYRQQPPPDSTLEALIGVAFRLTSINLLFTSDVMADLGVLVARHHELGVTESLTPYFKAASLFDFEYYARQVLYPYYLKTSPDISYEELTERNSLRAIGSYLGRADKIGLIHNADDILLTAGELDFLRDVFGARAQIYPRGGHSGNMLYRDNVAYIIDFFSG
jgi:pimeloyl-ACP methyl ester carboxylesterase